MSYSTQDLIHIAKLYYRSEYTHKQIAEKLGINRITVTRMIHAAHQRGIVKIDIKGELEGNSRISMSSEMELLFNLKKAIIIPYLNQDNYDILNAVTKSAGDYFESIIKDGDIVGLGWGMCVAGMVRNYFPTKRHDALFVPVLGGLDERDFIYNLPELTGMLAEKCGGSLSTLYAPAIVDSVDVRNMLRNDSNIQKVINLWRELDILIMGIGALRSKMPQALKNYLSSTNDNFQEKGVVCDLCFNFMNEQGKKVYSELDQRIIGIDLTSIQKTPNCIAIAFGPNKVAAIHAALWSECIDVLVTDDKTALSILEMTKP